jgi:hypothetical protein
MWGDRQSRGALRVETTRRLEREAAAAAVGDGWDRQRPLVNRRMREREDREPRRASRVEMEGQVGEDGRRVPKRRKTLRKARLVDVWGSRRCLQWGTRVPRGHPTTGSPRCHLERSTSAGSCQGWSDRKLEQQRANRQSSHRELRRRARSRR